MKQKQLSKLIQIDVPETVLEEGRIILLSISPDFNVAPVEAAFTKVLSLYRGTYPGYRACNTRFHDLHHTTDTFLAMVRMLHGAVLNSKLFDEHNITVGLISALLHDAGYIQDKHDTEGTGAKYTENHIQRSMEFLQREADNFCLSDKDVDAGCAMILCSDLGVGVSNITFPSPEIELLGRILGIADLLAQMADRIYLEKLEFLYQEYKEAEVGDYKNEIDLLKKTLEFYDFIAQRQKQMLDGTDLFLTSHFTARWNIRKNLYTDAIKNQKNYLKQILGKPDADPRDYLTRNEIVDNINSNNNE